MYADAACNSDDVIEQRFGISSWNELSLSSALGAEAPTMVERSLQHLEDAMYVLPGTFALSRRGKTVSRLLKGKRERRSAARLQEGKAEARANRREAAARQTTAVLTGEKGMGYLGNNGGMFADGVVVGAPKRRLNTAHRQSSSANGMKSQLLKADVLKRVEALERYAHKAFELKEPPELFAQYCRERKYVKKTNAVKCKNLSVGVLRTLWKEGQLWLEEMTAKNAELVQKHHEARIVYWSVVAPEKARAEQQKSEAGKGSRAEHTLDASPARPARARLD